MKMIYEHYSCRKYNEPPPLTGKAWVKAIHYIQSFDPRGRTMKYNEWENKKHGTSWKEKIRIAIDGLLGTVKNLDDLICELEEQGFTVKRGKYISVRAVGQERFVRLKALGDYYSEDILCEKIQIALEKNRQSNGNKINSLNKIFYERIYQVSELVKKNEKLPRKYFKNQPYILQNDFDVYTLSAQLAVINRDNISSIGELESKIEKLTAEYESARQEVNKLSEKLSQFEAVEKQVGGYFDLLEKSELSEAEKLQLKMYGSLAERCNIHSRDELQRVEKLRKDTSEKVERLNEQMKKCKQLYDTYAGIADTYKKISKGDYISNFIAEKKREDERKKNITHKKLG